MAVLPLYLVMIRCRQGFSQWVHLPWQLKVEIYTCMLVGGSLENQLKYRGLQFQKIKILGWRVKDVGGEIEIRSFSLWGEGHGQLKYNLKQPSCPDFCVERVFYSKIVCTCNCVDTNGGKFTHFDTHMIFNFKPPFHTTMISSCTATQLFL